MENARSETKGQHNGRASIDPEDRKVNIVVFREIQKSIVDECCQKVPQSGPGEHVRRIMPLAFHSRPRDARDENQIPRLDWGSQRPGHRSNQLEEWVNNLNLRTTAEGAGPVIEFVPLPSSAQFSKNSD